MRGYRLTSGDLISATFGDWDRFAIENGGARALTVQVLGQSLFDSIDGPATRRFLEQIFYDCRRNQSVMGQLYRCDSPQVERLFAMRVLPLPAGGIEVQHRLIRCRPLAAPAWPGLPHLRYRRCSQCLACNFGGPWVEGHRFRLPSGAVAEDAVCPVCRGAVFPAVPPLRRGPQAADAGQGPLR